MNSKTTRLLNIFVGGLFVVIGYLLGILGDTVLQIPEVQYGICTFEHRDDTGLGRAKPFFDPCLPISTAQINDLR